MTNATVRPAIRRTSSRSLLSIGLILTAVALAAGVAEVLITAARFTPPDFVLSRPGTATIGQAVGVVAITVLVAVGFALASRRLRFGVVLSGVVTLLQLIGLVASVGAGGPTLADAWALEILRLVLHAAVVVLAIIAIRRR